MTIIITIIIIIILILIIIILIIIFADVLYRCRDPSGAPEQDRQSQGSRSPPHLINALTKD